MIYTSCFTSPLIKGLDLQLVAVCLSVPENIKCNRFLALAPNNAMLAFALKGKMEEFSQLYKSHVLDRLNLLETYKALDGSVLLTWEQPDIFSHRRLIANWLEGASGQPVIELDEAERAALGTLAALQKLKKTA
jgi:hypothetical protein